MILAALRHEFHKELDELHGFDEVETIFVLLTEHYVGFSRLQVSINKDFLLDIFKLNLFQQALDRLKLHEPVQYIMGSTYFYGLKFNVNKHTLIPRPETEELVHWALHLSTNPMHSSLKILDIGTGSGCIAISLAKNIENAQIVAIDLSAEALAVASENSKLNKTNVQFYKEDIFNLLEVKILEDLKFDFIISNPPYVRELEKKDMKPNVINFEPESALFVPNHDSLRFYEAIALVAQKHLKSGGFLLLEINQYLSDEMINLLEFHNFEAIELRKDLFGNFRMIKAIQP